MYISEQKRFGRKVNQDVHRNRKLFWKEVSKVNRGKVESYSILNYGNCRLALGEDEIRRI